MTLHSLVLISDSFSCNCNSIQSPVSIVHLRVNLILSHPLLRLYINYSISNANQFQLVQQCIQISTRINSSMYIRTYFVCFIRNHILLACNSTRVCDPKCNTNDFELTVPDLYLHCLVACQQTTKKSPFTFAFYFAQCGYTLRITNTLQSNYPRTGSVSRYNVELSMQDHTAPRGPSSGDTNHNSTPLCPPSYLSLLMFISWP